MNFKSFFVLAGVGFFMPIAANAASCVPIIKDAVAHLNSSTPREQHTIGFALSSSKAQAKFVGYSSGAFTQGTGGMARAVDATSVFSDRAWCPELQSGSLCTNYQAFDYRKADKMDVALLPINNGVMRVTLKSWGGATYDIPLSCSKGFMYGALSEANGDSFMVMSLQKNTIQVPR